MSRLALLYKVSMLSFMVAGTTTQACFTSLPQDVQKYLLMFVLDRDSIVKSMSELYNLRLVNKSFYSYFSKAHLLDDYSIKLLASRLGITPRAVALHGITVCRLNKQERLALLSKYQANKDLDMLLIKAAEEGNRELVQNLLFNNANVNARDNKFLRGPALIRAARRGFIEIVRLLLMYGVNVNIQDGFDKTALMHASYRGSEHIVGLLLAYGATVDIQTKVGDTALMLATSEGYGAIVTMLINAGADVNIQDESGRTALIVAAQVGHRDIVELLISAGANVDTQDKWGNTALERARLGSYEEIILLLQQQRNCCFIQ